MCEPLKIWIFLLLVILPLSLSGQENTVVFSNDTIQPLQPIEFKTILNDSIEKDVIPAKMEVYKPDPIRAIWLGAVIPGYGQIVNKKYWKLPIVYGGFLGCFYAVNWNAGSFTAYKNAYLDIIDGDDKTNSFMEIIPEGYTIDSYGGEAAFTNLLKSGMDKARYNRDLSIIVTVAYYGLTLIDAFVDAHLYDFDISTDLSMKLTPAIINDRYTMNGSSKSSFAYGISGYIKF